MKNEPRNQYTFYRSYYDAIQRLSKKDQSAIILAVCAYALYETQPSELSDTASACFALIRPTLDSGRRKAENGTKGGRKSRPQAKQKQPRNEEDTDTDLDSEYECTCPNDDNTIVEQILALYHSLCPDLPPCQILSPATRRAICSRWADHPDMAVFNQVFSAAQRSNLLTGKQVNWRASLDWLMDHDHFAKVYNGSYDNTAPKNNTVPTGGSGVLGEAEREAIRRVLDNTDTAWSIDRHI